MFVPQISVAILSCWQVCASGVRRRGKQAFANSANVQPKVFESPGPKVLRSIAFFCVAESELRETQSDLYIYNYIIHMCSHAVEYIYILYWYMCIRTHSHLYLCHVVSTHIHCRNFLLIWKGPYNRDLAATSAAPLRPPLFPMSKQYTPWIPCFVHSPGTSPCVRIFAAL